jgi:hypothetical protein
MLYENDYCCADCYTCQCHLIERVRADERVMAAQRVTFAAWEFNADWSVPLPRDIAVRAAGSEV